MKTKLTLIFSAVLTIGLFTIVSCEGPEGLTGHQDTRGEQGPPGPVGPAGEGATMHAGEGEPANSTGEVGDYYLDLASDNLFGPKPAEGWGEPVHLHGPQGPPGEAGGSGRIHAGDGEPDGGLGSEGDYYLDRNNYDLYGPKTGSGWGTPIHLQGPQGEQGPEGTIPVEGPGTRLMWYPGKAAFRAGDVDGTQWDDANIGEYSVAMGRNTTASGVTSTAMGVGTTTSGFASTAMGMSTTASGFASTAMGRDAGAGGDYSTAMGRDTDASGHFSTAMGLGTTAATHYSTAMGLGTTAATTNSLSIGKYNNANRTADGTLFVAGNGDSSSPSDALVLTSTGKLTIAGTIMENSDRRLKNDIHFLESDVLHKLGAIHPVRYQFKNQKTHPGGPQIGLIAQQVQAQFPELISQADNGYLSVSYSKFTAVLLKGLQVQQAEIERLRSENEAINERLTLVEQQSGVRSPKVSSLLLDFSNLSVLLVLAFLGMVFYCRRWTPHRIHETIQRD